jgi:hypothetical protein
MPKATVNTSLLAAILSVALWGTAPSSFAEPVQLQMRQDQMIKPADFTSVEANFYKTLDLAAQQNFIATRSFVRVSQQVVDGILPPSQLPDRPAGFSVKYLLRGESFDINNALAGYLTAKNGGEGNLVSAMTAGQMLQLADLNLTEVTYFRTLGALDAKRFMATRSYVRLCRQVLDQKLPAYQLPKAPPGIRGAYLFAGERDLISKAMDASLHDLLQRYPDSLNKIR